MRIRTGAFAVLVAAIVPLLLASVGEAAPAGASAGAAKTYVVVLKGNPKAGLAAIQQAGGRVLDVSKLGVGRVSLRG
jgi:hypothetical protein